jgi:SAM-dependent methyltransferase
MWTTHDSAEIARSASEARKVRIRDVDLTRYQNPPGDTCYPLEYAFFLLGNAHDKLVVDLGCGAGEEVVPLLSRGARVIGIDISPHLIAIARERLRRYGLDAELQVASAYETHLPDASVDVVFCMSVLHHLQVDRINTEVRRILKPDGLFIIKEPVRFSRTMDHLRKLFPPKEDVSEFEHPLSSNQLQVLAEGFQVLASRSFRTPAIPLLNRMTQTPYLKKRIWSCDAWILLQFPNVAHFATMRVMALRPSSNSPCGPVCGLA